MTKPSDKHPTYDPAAIKLLGGLASARLPQVDQWTRDDWLRAVFRADDDPMARAQIMTMLAEAHPIAANECKTVLQFWEHDLRR